MKREESRGLIFLIIVTFLFVLGNLIFQPVLTLYMREVGASVVEVSLMLAVFSLTETFSRIPFGLASHKYGKRKLILFALVTQFVSIFLLYLVHTPSWFYPVLAFRAIPFSAFWSTATALASELAPEGRRGEAMGKYFTGFGLAMFFGPLLCSFLIEFMSYRDILIVMLAFPLASVVIFLKTGVAKIKSESHQKSSEEPIIFLDSVKRIFQSKTARTLILVGILNSTTLGAFNALFSIYANEILFFTPSLIATLFTIRGGANALIRIPIGWISDKIRSRKIPLIVSFSLYAATYLIISMTGDYFFLLLAMILFGLGWGMRAVVNTTFLTENVDLIDREMALSISITTFSIGSFIGSTLAGSITFFLSTPDIFKISAILFLPVIIAVIVLTKEENRIMQ